MKSVTPTMGLLALAVLCGSLALPAQDLTWFETRLTEHRLENGLTVLIYERSGAPIVSFFTHIDVGSAQEVPGITGLAHMFEHMAFKGTSRIGTSDHGAEQRALRVVDDAYAAHEAERRRVGEPDSDKLAALKETLALAQEEAARFVVGNEYENILSRAGAVGLNAGTSTDLTIYLYSLPANKVELWAYMEAERFLDPVMREFYKERDVVMEERRLRVESQPIGRLIEQLLGAAFIAHPYKNSTTGHMSDLQSFTRQDAVEFFKRHYVPANMTIAIVGAVKAQAVIPLVDAYFGRLPRGEPPPPLRTEEPQQIAERIVRMPDPSQPIYVEAYHRPADTHPDSAVYDALSDILSAGRTARLYRRLVQEDKIAAQVTALGGFPGNKYPHLMLFLAIPTPGHSNEEVQVAIREELERLKREPVTEEELQRARTRARAGLIRSLRSSSGIGQQLVLHQSLFGDWRELFRAVERIEQVTPVDIQRVAKETFVTTNRTVAMIVTPEENEVGP